MIAHYDHKEKKAPHYLDEHVQEMICYLKAFSLPKAIKTLAKICIHLHDVGKKSKEFQTYVQDPNGKRGSVKHALGGAYALQQKFNDSSLESQIAYFAQLIIAGHHTGLSDYTGYASDLYQKIPPELIGIEKLAENEVNESLEQFDYFLIEEFERIFGLGEEGRIYFATLVRFAMSAMVDADWLSTEAYFSQDLAEKRKYEAPSFKSFQKQLEAFYDKGNFPDSTVELTKVKKTLQTQARHAGEGKHSYYTLHAPTGAGKTIAGLEFALSHAIEYEKRRVITALPLMNLTEETSALYRDIFGDEHVIEDHSTALVEADDEDASVHLAVGNWNRPFVVTTTNQLMESLFHNRPMKIRKLHRLYGSIIILDEYHKLPFHVLRPILKQLDILQTYFDVTVLMMSATPFALTESSVIRKFELNHQPVEIADREVIFNQVPERVAYEWLREKQTIESLTDKISKEETVLVVVNTRVEAQRIFLALKKTNHSFEKIYHLSTTMCSHHRKRTLESIHNDLENNRLIAVVSTSVLEAGVDISFPVVYRMIAPVDAIVQAAGRCNRYGRGGIGRVIIFELQSSIKVDLAYRQGIGMTRAYLEKEGVEGLGNVEVFIQHYKEAFSDDVNHLDKNNITESRWLEFESIANEFKMIETEQVGVICTSYEHFKEEWLLEKRTRDWWKKLQPYTVSLNRFDKRSFKEDEEIRILTPQYDKELGVILERS